MTEIKQIANTYSKRVKNSIGIAHKFFTLLLASSRSPIFNFSLFTQILLYIRLYLLEFRRELVEGVLLHHHFHLAQTVLIACHLGACLLGMNRPGTCLLYTSPSPRDNEGNEITLQGGESIVVPASTQTLKVEGTLKFLETYV